MSESTDTVITVERREAIGSSSAGKLRRQGKIPAVVYGGDKDTMAITVDQITLKDLLRQERGENTIFLLKLAGTKQERRAMIRDIQIDPISRDFVHVDFIRITRGHKLTVSVPIVLEGDSVGSRRGGLCNFKSRELTVEVLPREMLDRLVVDISELDLGEHIRVKDLEPMLPESGRFMEDPERIVATMEIPRTSAEDAAEEDEAELVIGDQAEPEVIGRTKDEEAGD